jgi:hypothetical protein
MTAEHKRFLIGIAVIVVVLVAIAVVTILYVKPGV